MISRNGGSALAWAVCLLLVLSVLLAGMAGISAAYERRGLRDFDQNRAYLAASAAVEAVLSLADGAPEGELPILPPGVGEKVELTGFDLGNISFDSLTAHILRLSPDELRVSALAVCGGAQLELSAVLRLEASGAGNRQTWSFFRYE